MMHPTATHKIGHRATATLEVGHRASAALRFEQGPTPALRYAEVQTPMRFDFGSSWLVTLGPVSISDSYSFVAVGSLNSVYLSTSLLPLGAELGRTGSLEVTGPLHTEGITPAVLPEFSVGGSHSGSISPNSLAPRGSLPLPPSSHSGQGYVRLEKHLQVVPAEDDE